MRRMPMPAKHGVISTHPPMRWRWRERESQRGRPSPRADHVEAPGRGPVRPSSVEAVSHQDVPAPSLRLPTMWPVVRPQRPRREEEVPVADPTQRDIPQRLRVDTGHCPRRKGDSARPKEEGDRGRVPVQQNTSLPALRPRVPVAIAMLGPRELSAATRATNAWG